MLRIAPSLRNRLLALLGTTALLCLVITDLRTGGQNPSESRSISLDSPGYQVAPPSFSPTPGSQAPGPRDSVTYFAAPIAATAEPHRSNSISESIPYEAKPLPQYRPASTASIATTPASHLPTRPSTNAAQAATPELLVPYRAPTIDWQLSERVSGYNEPSYDSLAPATRTLVYDQTYDNQQVQLASAFWSDPDSPAVAPSRLPAQPSTENRTDIRRDPGTVDVGARSAPRTSSPAAAQESENSEEEQRRRRTNPQNESPNSPPDTPERLGVPPPKEQPQFLRDSTVLLSPGEYQFEWGLTYTTNVSQTVVSRTLENQTLVANLTSTSRNLQVPMEFRVGIRPEVQGFISLPIGYAIQDISLANTKDSESVFGVGDLGMGITRVLRQGEQGRANILGTLACSAPTGATVIPAAQQLPGASLGSGFWTFTGGVTAVKSIDPVAVFFGINYTLTLDTALNEEVTLNPGDILSYRLGTGFAINSRISLSTVFEGNYIGELQFNDRYLPGTAREPFTVRIASTIQADPNRKSRIAKARRAKTTEPFVRFGLSDASPDVNLGIRWTY